MTAPPRLRGFTLIELMVAISVLAILLLLAVPSYLDRLVIDQVNEALPLANLAKPPVESAWRAGTDLPADNKAAGLPEADKIVNQVVSSVALDNGAIHITFGNKANKAIAGKVLSLRPAVVEDARIVPVTWLCGRTAPPAKMVAKGADRTNIPQGLLPGRCRAV